MVMKMKNASANFAALWLFIGVGAAMMGVYTWWEHENELKHQKMMQGIKIPDQHMLQREYDEYRAVATN